MLRLIACVALATTASISAAAAADLYIPSEPMPIMESYGFDWEGLYAGVEIGATFWDGDGETVNQGLISGTIGYNFLVADPILVGVELEGSYLFETDDGPEALGEVMAYGRIGVLATEAILLYGIGGAGWIFDEDDSETQYALGVGIEAAVTESISVRGEFKAYGFFDDDEAFTRSAATAGVFFHF